jgi:HD superfamily phosphohydrolase
MDAKTKKTKQHIFYDPLYGFIQLTPLEWEIIHTPFYQRLRWIKQIGFSCYTFPGAEHSRFGHSIGVMFNAHKIIKSIGRGVRDEDLASSSKNSENKSFHQNVRLAALLHDLGTFPFSHTTEASYIKFGDLNKKNTKKLPDNHEHLGSFIIKNTDFPGGITSILKKYGINPQKISDLVKGIGPNILANQILHSEIDCDRMDYLLRDAYYTGLKYGAYDRDYLLHHFKTVEVGGQDILVIKHNALHCVEDFLMARFAWYSQVVRSHRGAKFDALAEELCYYLLERGKLYSFDDLLDMAKNNPYQFFEFNDSYFMKVIHELLMNGYFKSNQKMNDIAHALLFEDSPRTVKCDEFKQRILSQDADYDYERYRKKALDKLKEIENVLKKKGTAKDWVVSDIPDKNVQFVKSRKRLIKTKTKDNVLLERDPAKILFDNGDVKLLHDVENSIISKLEHTFNFIPNVYCSQSAYDLLIKEKIVVE